MKKSALYLSLVAIFCATASTASAAVDASAVDSIGKNISNSVAAEMRGGVGGRGLAMVLSNRATQTVYNAGTSPATVVSYAPVGTLPTDAMCMKDPATCSLRGIPIPADLWTNVGQLVPVDAVTYVPSATGTTTTVATGPATPPVAPPAPVANPAPAPVVTPAPAPVVTPPAPPAPAPVTQPTQAPAPAQPVSFMGPPVPAPAPAPTATVTTSATGMAVLTPMTTVALSYNTPAPAANPAPVVTPPAPTTQPAPVVVAPPAPTTTTSATGMVMVHAEHCQSHTVAPAMVVPMAVLH